MKRTSRVAQEFLIQPWSPKEKNIKKIEHDDDEIIAQKDNELGGVIQQ